MPQKHQIRPSHLRFASIFLFAALLVIGITVTGQSAFAEKLTQPRLQGSPLHPSFPFLDTNGENVLDTGNAVSTMQTCGTCHDTQFIEKHSYHANAGFDDLTTPGETPSERAWDISPGFFGTWNPIAYRYLSPLGDERTDLSTAEWMQTLGSRHPGGGPAVYSRDGTPLLELEYSSDSPETNIVDPETGELVPWDWSESGVVEMNCFLCHTPDPNNEARKDALHNGQFQWANTATLLGSGIVTQNNEGEFVWNRGAFNTEGELDPSFVALHDPTDSNCGLCHGLVHDNVETPLTMAGCSPERWTTITTGQIISSQRLSDSGMNLYQKESLSRPWDVHAERQLKCTDCHYALNNPLYYQEGATRPEHLDFDPRRLELGEYLLQPLHQFARGDSAQSMVSPNVKDTMRRCDDCHSTEATHDWLPYKDRHTSALSCESCHIPKMYSSANQQYDWTVINLDSSAQTECRGAKGEAGMVSTLLTGYEPVLLTRADVNGTTSLVPHNLITTWFWVYGDPERPALLRDLEAAYLEGDQYHPDVLAGFDANNDGNVDDGELVIDTEAKEALIKERLNVLGLDNPRIVGEIQPYSIHHDVATSEWATQDCQACHSESSRITAPIMLSSYAPGGVTPTFVSGSNVITDGEIHQADSGELYYQPMPEDKNLYVLGSDKVDWIDTAGLWIFFAVLAGIAFHGGLRIYASYRGPAHETKTEKVYMYSVYERFWHWLQTFAIVFLLFTGLIIHRPDSFGIFSFSGVVVIHNVLATILAVNAGLSLFFHLASGEIQQYIPRPRGFFDQTITQAKFYLGGIFKGEEHPFEKTQRKKLNPLQQITYFGILNVLLPLQGITGILIWGAQRWPALAESLGGLSFLAPFHTLVAWLFGSFIVMHVYLTTTGHTPLTGINSMIMGWDDVEIHSHAKEEVKK